MFYIIFRGLFIFFYYTWAIPKVHAFACFFLTNVIISTSWIEVFAKEVMRMNNSLTYILNHYCNYIDLLSVSIVPLNSKIVK